MYPIDEDCFHEYNTNRFSMSPRGDIVVENDVDYIDVEDWCTEIYRIYELSKDRKRDSEPEVVGEV